MAYKEGDQSKFKSGQNARTNAAKRTLSESTSTPSVVSTPSNSQRPENDNISHTPSQNQSSSRPKPPPPKKAHVVPSESPTHPANTDSDDHFVVVDTKMESELDSDHMEDQLDNNGPESSRVCVKRVAELFLLMLISILKNPRTVTTTGAHLTTA